MVLTNLRRIATSSSMRASERSESAATRLGLVGTGAGKGKLGLTEDALGAGRADCLDCAGGAVNVRTGVRRPSTGSAPLASRYASAVAIACLHMPE